MIKNQIKDMFRPYYRFYYHKIYTPICKMICKPSHEKKMKQSYEYITTLKNAHYGKRCFIIGNGPSLKLEDLSKLKKEICFGSHCIFEIFDKTDWRPTYYCAQDYKLIKKQKNNISYKVDSEKFIASSEYTMYPYIKDAHYVKINNKKFYPELPLFSEDISEMFYGGWTVTYMAIQIAAYMGFKSIYLLGIDHNYSVTLNPDGSLSKQNLQDHFSENDRITNVPQLYKSTLAYEAARQYADAHGIKIYNATRGGKLEVFERVDFDTLFKGEKYRESYSATDRQR